MPVPAITISRQLGSLGTLVASEVAGRLGYRVVHRQLINEAARRAGAPEVALAVIDDLGLLGVRPSAQARQAYQRAVQQVMEELAAQGKVVIVGRAGQVILRQHPEVLHVKVMAPVPVRSERVARELGISLEAAHAQVLASDRARSEYLRRYYHARWDDPCLYDLIINTARLSPRAAADVICLCLDRRLQASATQAPKGELGLD